VQGNAETVLYVKAWRARHSYKECSGASICEHMEEEHVARSALGLYVSMAGGRLVQGVRSSAICEHDRRQSGLQGVQETVLYVSMAGERHGAGVRGNAICHVRQEALSLQGMRRERYMWAWQAEAVQGVWRGSAICETQLQRV
jgi:hypothetical protein